MESKKSLYNLNIIFYSVGQVFISILVGVSLCCFLPEYSIVIFVFGCISVFSAFTFYILYSWLNLDKTFFSLIWYNILVLITLGFIYSFFLLVKGLPSPIFVKDLTLLSQYRYAIFSIAIIIFVLLYILSYSSVKMQEILNIIKYPYLKEEVRKILYVWNDSFMGDLCIFFYEKIYTSKIFRIFFFFTHFIIVYFTQFLVCYFMFKFTFLGGDLRPILYLSPLVCIRWLTGFLEYYFKIFRQGTEEYIKDMLIITPKNSQNQLQIVDNYYTFLPGDLIFKLSSEGVKEGFGSTYNFNLLVSKWYCCSNVAVIYERYTFYTRSLQLFNVSVLVLCWFALTHNYIFYGVSELAPTGFFLFRKSLLPIFPLRYPREVRFGRNEMAHNNIKNASNKAVEVGHPVVGEVEGNDFRVDGSLTHGQGVHPNVSYELINGGGSRIIPLQYGPQRMPLNWFTPPLPGSTTALEDPEIKKQIEFYSTLNLQDQS